MTRTARPFLFSLLAVGSLLIVGCQPTEEVTGNANSALWSYSSDAPSDGGWGLVSGTALYDDSPTGAFVTNPITTGPIAFHYIFYGTWTAAQRQIFLDFATGLSGSPMANVLATYVDGSGNRVPSSFTVVDGITDNYSHGKNLGEVQLSEIIDNAVTVGGLPNDPLAFYMIVLAADVNVSSYPFLCTDVCGTRDLDSFQFPALRFGWVGNPQYCADHGLGHCVASVTGPNGDPNVDYMVNTVWQELADAATDPNSPKGYHVKVQASGNVYLDEIADICRGGHALDGAYPAVGPVELDLTYAAPNGASANVHLGSRDFLVQPIWQNVDRGGCVRRVALNRPVAQVPNIATGTTGDLDHNYVADLIWRYSPTGEVAGWLLNPNNTILSSGAISTPGENYQIIGVADFNTDAKADLIWREVRTGQISVWLMNGLSIASIRIPISSLASNFLVRAVGDFDGDGDADILFQDMNSNNALYMATNPDPATTMSLVPVGFDRIDATDVIGTGDFDGDAAADVLWHDLSNDSYYVRSFKKGTSTNISGAGFSSLLGIVDIDRDNVADLVAVSTNKTNVVWLKMVAGQPGPPQTILAMPLPQWRFSGGSQLTDLATHQTGILWRNRQSGDVARWLVDNSGHFISSNHIAVGVTQEWELVAY